ncbi:T9SS type A sorting domain-containing protein [Lacinutrix undariae]
MKKFYLLLMVLMSTYLGFGQTTIFENSCDNQTASDWSFSDTSQQSGYWKIDEVDGYVTSETFGAYSDLVLVTNLRSYGGGSTANCLIEISTDNGATWDGVSQSFTDLANTYINYTFNIGTLTGSTNKIRWLRNTGTKAVRVNNIKLQGTLSTTNTQVQFTAAEASVSEGIGTYNLEFAILNEDVAATNFEVALTTGDASEINNYSTQTITFPANSATNQTATITVTDDTDFEPDDTLTFTIQNVTGGNSAEVGSQDTFNLTITNNDATPPTTLPYNEDFTDCGTAEWTPFDESASKEWTCTYGAYTMNGFGNNDDIDWLISDFTIDFSAYTNPIIDVTTKEKYGNTTNEVGEFELRYSTDYSGSGDPTTATWTALTFNPNNTSSGGGYSPSSITSVEASGITGVAYLAFVYDTAAGSGAEEWVIENVSIDNVIAKDQDTEIYESTTPITAITLTAEDNTTVATSVDVFAFNIEDQGTSDGLPTNITTMRFVPGTNNTADWTDHLQGITLYDDSLNDYTPTTTTIEDDEIVLTFSTPIAIADATAVEFFLGVYLNTTNITDGSILEFNIPETASGFTADTAGSGFASSLPSGEVNSSQFTIDVEVTQLAFTQQPTDTEIEAIMTPQVTVAAVDTNGNIDTDYNSDITITSTGTLTGTSIVANATNGVATFATLIHTVIENGLTLTANDGYAGPVTSNTFNSNAIVIVPSLIISEVADPDNNASNGRFVELYNNGTTTIDLDAQNIYLVKQVNGNNINDITLTGTINPGEVYVISGSTSFNNTYGFDSNNNNNQVSGNGDDGYYLYFDGNYSSGTLLDAYGVIGEDGSGKDWVYENARAIRNNPKTTSPNATWTASEWTITDADDVDMTPGALENEFRYNNAAWMPRNGFDNATSGDEVIIFSNINANDNLTAKSLEIKTGATYTVTPGNAMTITENIINNGNLTLQSTATSFASVIVDGTLTGTVNYQRFVNATANGNDLIAPPLVGQTWADFLTNNQSVLLSSGTTYGFAPFDKTAIPAQYVNYTDATVSALVNGLGYRTATAAGETLTFTGTVATAPVVAPITTSGAGYEQWNLIGNPFPSYITLSEFLTENNAKFATEEAGIYGYNGSDFTVYNLAYAQANPGTQIAPGQGFYVAAATVAETVTFTNAMRAIGTEDDFINGRTNNTSISHLQLQLNTASNATATEFYFTANASQGLDHGYDAARFGNTIPEFALYSHLVQDNQGRAMLVQSLSDNDLTNVTIALGVNANQGEQMTFSINASTIPETVQVYLEDNVTNTFTLLNTGDYTITPSETINGTGRFFLRYADSALNTVENELNGINVFAKSDTKTIEIRGLLAHKTTCTLYDIQGRAIKTETLNTNTNAQAITTNNLSAGVYIVKLTNNTQQKTQKVIIK